jgi:hypothetical protein
LQCQAAALHPEVPVRLLAVQHDRVTIRVDRHIKARGDHDLGTHDQGRTVDGERDDAAGRDRLSERGAVAGRERAPRSGGAGADHRDASRCQQSAAERSKRPADHRH